MKVLLAYASIDEFTQKDTDWDYDGAESHYPLGLAYLHSYLESQGREVHTQFLNNVPTAKCIEIIKQDIIDFKPDVVGVSMITHSRVGSYRLMEMVRKDFPHIHVVCGGMHVSTCYEQIATAYPGVVCVRGEGEVTLGELVDRWEKEETVEDVAGIAIHNGKELIVTPARAQIADIDILPFPKHSIFLQQTGAGEARKVAGMLSSRGCPYKCNFCVLDAVSRRKVRCRSAKNIADEVEMILTSYPSVDTIWLHDDAFMIIQDRTIEFCEEIIKRGIKAKFICSARFQPISRKVVMLMKEAGFVHVLFGLESGAPEVLRQMRKGITQKSARHGLKLFSETGIKATAFLISGLPGESEETIDQTIDFVQELQDIHYLYYDDMGVAGIYPGTELFEIAKREKMQIEGYGTIDDDFWMSNNDVPFYTVDHTYDKLLEWKEKIRDALAYGRWHLSPDNFLKQRKTFLSAAQYAWQHGFGTIIQAHLDIMSRPENQDMVKAFVHSGVTQIKDDLALQKLVLDWETEKIKWLFENYNMSPDQKKEFIQKYKAQVRADQETRKQWEKTQHEEQSGKEGKKTRKFAKEVVTDKGKLTKHVIDTVDGYKTPQKQFNIVNNSGM